MGETGERAATALVRMIESGRRPGLAIARPDIVIPSIMSATSLEPLATIIAEARALEAAGDCDISLMAGFSYADSVNTGMSVICLDWDGVEAAQRKADALCARLRNDRGALSSAVPVTSVTEAIADVEMRPASGGPIVLLEHADRMNDSTHVLRALIGRDVGRVHVPFLLDPQAAIAAADVGVGSTMTVNLAGRSDPATGGPLSVDAKVVWAGQKSYTVSGRYQRGSLVDLGATALLDIGRSASRSCPISPSPSMGIHSPSSVSDRKITTSSCYGPRRIFVTSTSRSPAASSSSTPRISVRRMSV